ncbi:MAG: LPS export ABC transporter periplasmic protein LptC [Saprospiraceae bacterium]|jgi:LPS export ABC transporter protein LptC|nr:LPS export ABC transporter periplasmic protein LptC [Saprospiraceae bacterium]
MYQFKQASGQSSLYQTTPIKAWFLLIPMFFFASCSNQESEVDALVAENIQSNTEKGKNIDIYYSDSAQVKLVIHAPEMIRYTEYGNTKDAFPKGILLEFLNENKEVYSWLKAESAIREEREQKITARGNVIFYNDKGEKLETPELIWDEKDRIVYTDKLVRITQAEKGDTTYGFGFRANQEFTRFEIKKKVQGKVNVQSITKVLE